MAKMITKTLDDKTLATLKDSTLEKLLPHEQDTLSYSLNNGLLFLITSKNKKSFALRYLFKEENGKSAQNLFRFGSFPAMTLNEARVEAERLKELAAQVGNLSRYFKAQEEKKLLEQEIESKSPFSSAVAHYFEKNKPIWSKKTYKVELGQDMAHISARP